jgi:hypothetical protein
MSQDNSEVILFDIIKAGLKKEDGFDLRLFIILLSFFKDFFGIF